MVVAQANQADLKGEGKLEMEGVRPQRYAAGMHPFGAPDSAGALSPSSACTSSPHPGQYSKTVKTKRVHISQGSTRATSMAMLCSLTVTLVCSRLRRRRRR